LNFILADGVITCLDSKITTNNSSISAPGQVLSYKIISGEGSYLFVQGYVVIVTDANNGRDVQFYFGNDLKL